MTHYQEPAGRGFEIIIGTAVLFVASIFIALLVILFANASISTVNIIGGAFLLFASYWFGQMAIRLIFNIPRKTGGLFSVRGLKIWSLFFGVSSVAVLIIGVYIGQWGTAVAGLCLAIGCFYGWQLACKRNKV